MKPQILLAADQPVANPRPTLRYRHVHLDFHTSPAIPAIGTAFDAREWQRTLLDAQVNSINIFAVCHHGWSYYDTAVGQRHPHLDFDLTRAQFDACKAVDINAPLYLTVGVNNRVAEAHPEWRTLNADGQYYGWSASPLNAGFHLLCFNTPYLDYVCAQMQELATRFPNADGLWLDIIYKAPCCCRWCMESMAALGLNAANETERHQHAELVLDTYYRRTLAALRAVHPTMPIFQNSGHVQRGERRFFAYVTHLELESLPTWGWGYDHFPMSAKYAKLSGLDYLGMTGKFHTTWGEFGGFKHPNALRYECAAMLAYGGKCGVGDQLHPTGRLDASTYALIGQAYAEVAVKEPWCDDARNVAEVALLSSVAVHPAHPREDHADTGAARLLLEGHLLFDIIDGEMDFSPYRLLILPDDVRVNPALQAKLDAYLAAGGKLLLTGTSGLDADGRPLFDLGAEVGAEREYAPEYLLPVEALRPSFVQSPFVVYAHVRALTVTDGDSLGAVYDPYFNRDYRHFCSHQHAPARPEPSGFACGVQQGNIMYLPLPLFTNYRAYGVVAHKAFALACIRRLLGAEIMFQGNLPSTARVTLTAQPAQARYVLHLLHANLLNRGGAIPLPDSGGPPPQPVEVIEDLLPLHDVEVSLKLPRSITRVTLEPQGAEIPFRQAHGRLLFAIDRFVCHQMVALHTDA